MTVLAESARLRALIGGRWAVSWQGYLTASPFGIGLVFLSVPSLWDAGSLVETCVRGLALGAISYVAAGLVLWLASGTLLKNRAHVPVPIWMVALTGAIAWAARSLIVMAYAGLQHDLEGPSAVSRLLLSSFQGALAVTLTAWLFGMIDEFSRQRRGLLDALVDEELAAEETSAGIEAMRAEVKRKVRLTVQESMGGALMTVSLPAEVNATTFHEQARRVSRDVAHELWAGAERTTRVGPAALVRFAVANRPFAYWALLPGVALGAVSLPSYWPGLASYATLIVVVVYALAVSAAANRLIPRLNARARLSAYAVTVALLFGSGFVWMLASSTFTPDGMSSTGAAWLAALAVGFMYPLLSLVSSLGRAQEDVLDRIRRSISAAEIRRAALQRADERIRRDLAVALHGGLQADLTAASMRAQQALEAGDRESANEVLDEARGLIARALDISAPRAMSLQEAIDSVVLSWTGLVQITTHVDVVREPSGQCVSKIHDVLHEGVGNAVRHGNARNVDIDIKDDGDRVVIVLKDDGRGEGDNSPGLGSSMLDDLAPNAWSRARQASGGSLLTVDLPLT